MVKAKTQDAKQGGVGIFYEYASQLWLWLFYDSFDYHDLYLDDVACPTLPLYGRYITLVQLDPSLVFISTPQAGLLGVSLVDCISSTFGTSIPATLLRTFSKHHLYSLNIQYIRYHRHGLKGLLTYVRTYVHSKQLHTGNWFVAQIVTDSYLTLHTYVPFVRNLYVVHIFI